MAVHHWPRSKCTRKEGYNSGQIDALACRSLLVHHWIASAKPWPAHRPAKTCGHLGFQRTRSTALHSYSHYKASPDHSANTKCSKYGTSQSYDLCVVLSWDSFAMPTPRTTMKDSWLYLLHFLTATFEQHMQTYRPISGDNVQLGFFHAVDE